MMRKKASRHHGIMASRGHGVMASRRAGFSLVEVLLAIFILGIGVISIAALFPAGIAQQRQSVDDVMGPIVAENALSILRSKLTQEDFGTFEEFSPGYPLNITVFSPRPTIPGDWSWRRPAFIRRVSNPDKWPFGAIDIFNGRFHGTATAQVEDPGGYPGSNPLLDAVPYNVQRYFNTPPAIIFTQEERLYPQASQVPFDQLGKRPSKPQYVWDCMFRRFQGKVLVAIFVYRVNVPGGEMTEYAVPQPYGVYPLVPVWLDLMNTEDGSEPWRGEEWDAFGEDLTAGTADDALIFGTSPELDTEFDLTNHAHQWQVAGQWLLDQNNNVHRVLSGRQSADDGPVELTRPVPALPAIPLYHMPNSPDGAENIVTDIWYLPLTMTDLSGQEFRLTPVYLTVKEL